MTAMTPIKAILWSGGAVFSQDHTNRLSLLAVAVSEEHAEWLAWSLGQAHNVDHAMLEELPPAQADFGVQSPV